MTDDTATRPGATPSREPLNATTATRGELEHRDSLRAYALRHGDDCLVLAQRLGEWISRAPELEEDIALANFALDVLGAGRALLQYAGLLSDPPQSEDDLAFGRDEREFTNLLIFEQSNGDFARAIAKQFFIDAYQDLLWDRLEGSSDETLSGVASKAVKESRYHLRHSRSWVIRLGDGTPESHQRMQKGLDDLWRFTHEMFIDDTIDADAARIGFGVLPSDLHAAWRSTVESTLREATLAIPDDTAVRTGGRDGRHTESMGPMLAEMQYLYRSYPGASW